MYIMCLVTTLLQYWQCCFQGTKWPGQVIAVRQNIFISKMIKLLKFHNILAYLVLLQVSNVEYCVITV